VAVSLVFVTCSDFRFHVKLWRRIKYTYVPTDSLRTSLWGTRAVRVVRATVLMDRHEQGFTYSYFPKILVAH